MIEPTEYPPHVRPLSDSTINPWTEKLVVLDDLVLAYRRSWLKSAQKDSKKKLIELREKRSSSTCVIVGNGPSLRNTDWVLLNGLDIFGSNYAYLLPELISRLKYLSVVNPWVAAQDPEAFNHEHLTVLTPFWLSCWLTNTQNTVLLNPSNSSAFETNVLNSISCRSTVSYFNLQLAYWLGYQKIILIGFDHSYVQGEADEGELIEQPEPDKNHFTTSYFEGKVWQAADTNKMEYVYALANVYFRRHHREIVNCSSTTALNVFKKNDLFDEKSGQHMTPPPLSTYTRLILKMQSLTDSYFNKHTLIVFVLAFATIACRFESTIHFAENLLGSKMGPLVTAGMSIFSLTILALYILSRHRRWEEEHMEVTTQLMDRTIEHTTSDQEHS